MICHDYGNITLHFDQLASILFDICAFIGNSCIQDILLHGLMVLKQVKNMEMWFMRNIIA